MRLPPTPPPKMFRGSRSIRHLLVACACLCALVLSACGQAASNAVSQATGQEQPASYTTLVSDFRNTDLGVGWEPTGGMTLRYARCFTVDYFDGGYVLVCTADGNRYLMVPDGAMPPEGLASDVILLPKPASDVYLAASDSLCLFDALGKLDCITVSGIERDDWYLDAMRVAMDAGTVTYGGKYRTPDYELLVARGVRLAVESSMINHAPDVREKLMELGIPVLVELSSYESDPLGRAEWVRLYGELLDCPELAQNVFDDQMSKVSALNAQPTGKTVAFFYLNGNGAAVVRRPGDYVTKMIEQAGGAYVFDGLDEARAGSSTTTMEMEQFYASAKDADVIIYNATIDNPPASLDELVQKNELLADFKAVKSGNVWVCEQDMYQQMIETGGIIADLNHVFVGSNDELSFLRRLT